MFNYRARGAERFRARMCAARGGRRLGAWRDRCADPRGRPRTSPRSRARCSGMMGLSGSGVSSALEEARRRVQRRTVPGFCGSSALGTQLPVPGAMQREEGVATAALGQGTAVVFCGARARAEAEAWVQSAEGLGPALLSAAGDGRALRRGIVVVEDGVEGTAGQALGSPKLVVFTGACPPAARSGPVPGPASWHCAPSATHGR